MKYFNNIEQLANELKNRGVCSKNFIIGIDGFFGAGKTYLADHLAKILGTDNVNIIDIDNKEKSYYPSNSSFAIEYIDFDKLKSDIINIQRKTSIIFSSACLLQILGKIKISPDIYIYVKRMAKCVGRYPETWRDKDVCIFEGDVNEWENNEVSKTLKFDSQAGRSLKGIKEVIQYHQKYKPYKNAEYYWLRYE